MPDAGVPLCLSFVLCAGTAGREWNPATADQLKKKPPFQLSSHCTVVPNREVHSFHSLEVDECSCYWGFNCAVG